MRFVAGLAAVLDGEVELRGEEELARRPIEPLLDFLVRAGAQVHRPSSRRSLPITIRGPVFAEGGAIDASQSSQFASALLLALPLCPGRTRFSLRGSPVSAPYLAATIDVLARRGIRWRRRGASFSIAGPARPRAGTFVIPGDASSAAYLWAAGAVSGGSVEVRGLPRDRPQADLKLLTILRRMGSRVHAGRRGTAVAGLAERPFDLDLTDAPDLLPLVGVLAAGARGPSWIRGAHHAALKESDRRKSTLALVRQLGAQAVDRKAGLRVVPSVGRRALRFELPDDHRLVMSAAVAAVRWGGSVDRTEAVRKSYPGFWKDLRSLGLVAGRQR